MNPLFDAKMWSLVRQLMAMWWNWLTPKTPTLVQKILWDLSYIWADLL